ncbi:G patch domain-containing protein 4 [Salminus brasiliensis]|uniref:G patch domain-containing protein 4 n=1 Tax=Salminus brasiliensis TaxID=930266 RepID=UPI003B82D91F
MAVATQDKSRGQSFAEQQLLRHGWEQGKGLGKNENGISEAIKVKVKCDKGGVGHKQSEQFTFHWWDHVFNKASSCLDVESGQDGVVVKKREGEEEEGMISNKKPRKAMFNKSNLYGCFVKSATLLSGKEQPERRLSSSEDSSSSDDDDDDKLDLSSTTKLSDDALMKACGGRTAHKGARHGLTMSAKLARLEQQELEFMAKYGKKEQTAKTASQCEDTFYSSVAKSELDQETAVNTKHKKTKKKKKQSTDELSENQAQEDDINVDASHIHHNEETPKKKKKRSKEQPSDTPDASVDNEVVNTKKRKRKHLEKDVSPEGVSGSDVLDENSTESAQQCEVDETAAHQLTGDKTKKKEKRKKKKRSEQMSVSEEGLNEGSAVSSEDSTDAKESHGQEQQEEGSVVLQPACESAPKKKKKKKKYSEPSREESLSTELETHHSLEATTEDFSTKKKKNKKKRKQEK